ncbi:unnamed protein product [Dicrocoelium dendriticum]|nr:unnamed protein product [Dicrocoelium dendriticum]
MKLNNIIQPITVGSSNMNQFCALADTAQPRDGPDQLLYPRQTLRYPYHLPKTTTSLFRPLSQPSFLQHGCPWNTSVEQSRWFDLPHPPFPETTGLQEAPAYPVLGLMTEATFTMPSTSPYGPLPFRPSYSAHESQVTHSSRNFPILLEKPQLLSNSDSAHKTHMNSPRADFAASDKCWPHVSTSGLVGTCYPVHYTTGHPAAPEPAEMVYRYTTSPLQGRAIRDAHVQTDEPPTPPSHLLRLENSRCAAAIGTHGLPTRPDSLLSSSSLTADSSASESAPNSSSSRDSALGGGCSSTHRTFETSKLSNTLSGTVESPKLHAMHFHQNRGVGTELVTPGESRRPTPFRVMRPKVSLAHTPLDMSHPPTPKRTALPSLNIVGDPPSSPLRTSQRIRAERKNSSYVNAALYQLPTTQAGDRRILGSLSPPTAWAQLLPYRVSTVPQNLSERLKKSETLPNDVWVHMQHSCSGIEREHQTIDGLSSICDASDWHKNACPRSPPPRPPMRTSSQKQATAIRPPLLSQQNHPVGNTSTRPSSDKTLPHATDPVVQTGDFVHAMFSSSHDQMEDSPVLCRYSQLYTLPFNPKSSAIPKNITERLPPPISSNVEPPVMQMGKLHLTS